MQVTLVFQEAGSHKFWQISTDGDSHTVSFGRVGTSGQSKTKTFADAKAALKDAEKLIASKKKKGYQEEDEEVSATEAVTDDAIEPSEPATAPPKATIANEEREIERLRASLRATEYEDDAAFLQAVRECASLSDPKPLFALVADYSNKLIVDAYMNHSFDEGKAVVEAYAGVFPVERGEMINVTRQIIASNGVVLAIFSGDSEIESLVFEKLIPQTLTHAPLALNLACFWAKKGNLEKLLEVTDRALNIGKVPADFIKDADFADYLNVPAFQELLDAHTPDDLKAMIKKLKAGAKFDAEMMNELTARWFEGGDGEGTEKRQAVEIIREYGNEKHTELVKGYDFQQKGKLFRYVCEESDSKTRTRMLKALGNDIHINDSRARELPEEMAAFAGITAVCLLDAFLKEFPLVLLQLPNLARLNLYASKIDELPVAIGGLTHLRELSLARNRLKTLPKEIAQLKELRTLNLENNQLEDLPEEVCELPKLQYVNFNDNKSVPGKQLNNLFEDFFENEVPVDLRKVMLNLLLDRKERAAELATREQLVAALNSSIAVIRTNAMSCLDSSEEMQTPLSPGTILLLGKLHGGAKVWKARLIENDFKPATKFAADLQCVVLGDKPGDVDLSGFQGRILTEVALKRLLDAVDTPYLQDEKQTSPELAENLGELLSSPDAANQLLALELMKTGGVPAGQFGNLLGVAYLADDAAVRKKAMTLLKANAPEPMQRMLAERMSFLNVATEDKMNSYIEKFAELDEINALTLARKVFASTGKGIKYLLTHGDEALQREVLSALIEGDKLHIIYRDLETMPAVLGEFTHLKDVRLHGNRLAEVPEALWKLTNLEQLDLSSNKLTEIPAELAKLTKLTSLDVAANKLKSLPAQVTTLSELSFLGVWNNKLKKFPKGLAKLKNVTKLTLDQMNLTDIPLEICEMAQLKELSLGYNKLQGLRPEVIGLTGLIKLRLGTNELVAFPEAVTTLKSLEELEIDFNKITEIPKTISALTNLKKLNCRANRGIQISQTSLEAMVPGCTLV
jgi:Leucine-rich repeat (LRR) protein/predicted DNA-binding WGR domain protein